MKNVIKKAVYAGLGLVNEGTTAVKKFGKEIAKKANLSEAEGHKIAQKLLAKSNHAVNSIRKTLDADVTKVADSIHGMICECDEAEPKKTKAVVPVKPVAKKQAKTTSVNVKLIRAR
jgi:polyhydroxyalkanoate synthesis regulator phasin